MIQMSTGDFLAVKRLLSYLALQCRTDVRGREKARQAALLLKKLERKERN